MHATCPMLLLLALSIFFAGCSSVAPSHKEPLRRIAFGSCIDKTQHPMLDQFLRTDFDLTLLLGDNIYADTTNMLVMQRKYQEMRQSRFWTGLRNKAPLMATWDDHDMGGNDAGADYPMKDDSQKLFMDFMDEPLDSPRRKQPGVYSAKVFGPVGRRVQVILLDTRYFRSQPAKGENHVKPSGGNYIPHPDTNTTLLGAAQWQWLREQLKVPAEIRILGSSIQFISEFSGAEAWANFPHEKRRLLNLIADANARGIIIVSGDRHWAELSRLDRIGLYPLYDLTSSALTQVHPRGTPTPNRFRDGPTYHQPNMGLILIDWEPRPAVTLQLLDENGSIKIEKRITDLGYTP
jgi:phosphodiesterase/alkaline phosphatase D-like protein